MTVPLILSLLTQLPDQASPLSADMKTIKEISKDPSEGEKERQSKSQRCMDINIAEKKEMGNKWCKEGKKP